MDIENVVFKCNPPPHDCLELICVANYENRYETRPAFQYPLYRCKHNKVKMFHIIDAQNSHNVCVVISG